MGETEEEKSPKCDKASASRQEPTNGHQFPDWTTMQAYYGPGVPLPPSYMHPAAMAGHGPHPHAWPSPQAVMPPYGMPYPAIYPHGVVYAHPAVPMASAPGNTQVHPKPPDTTEQGPAKKLKKLDGAVMEVVNFSAQIVERQPPVGSHSLEHGTESTDGSSKGGNGYNRDERQLKRERRKQANRESARRSRMRKQAETEELLERYETLKVENISLTSEINLLKEESEKLRIENGELMEKLNGSDDANPEILPSCSSPAPEVLIQTQDLEIGIKEEKPKQQL